MTYTAKIKIIQSDDCCVIFDTLLKLPAILGSLGFGPLPPSLLSPFIFYFYALVADQELKLLLISILIQEVRGGASCPSPFLDSYFVIGSTVLGTLSSLPNSIVSPSVPLFTGSKLFPSYVCI